VGLSNKDRYSQMIIHLRELLSRVWWTRDKTQNICR
jgi:hypothetical protein